MPLLIFTSTVCHTACVQTTCHRLTKSPESETSGSQTREIFSGKSRILTNTSLHAENTFVHCGSNKKLSYRRVTARCVLSVVILPVATQQCGNYLYDKSWPNRWYEVGGLVGGNVSWTMCTQPWCDRVCSHCLRCHKQTDDGRIVYITCIPTTCCGEIF